MLRNNLSKASNQFIQHKRFNLHNLFNKFNQSRLQRFLLRHQWLVHHRRLHSLPQSLITLDCHRVVHTINPQAKQSMSSPTVCVGK
jgi:hypothetical protein